MQQHELVLQPPPVIGAAFESTTRVRTERIGSGGRTVITVVHAGLPSYLGSWRRWWAMNAAKCCAMSLDPRWVCGRSAMSVACRASMAPASRLL